MGQGWRAREALASLCSPRLSPLMPCNLPLGCAHVGTQSSLRCLIDFNWNMSFCQKHQQFDSPNRTPSVQSTNALYITVFLPSRNVWSGYNTAPVPKRASSLFSSLIVPVKQIQIMKLQMPVPSPRSRCICPLESGDPNSDVRRWAAKLPCSACRPSEMGQGWVSLLPSSSISGPMWEEERESDEREREKDGDGGAGEVAGRGIGLCQASSNGKCYCHIHILEAIVVSKIPKA